MIDLNKEVIFRDGITLDNGVRDLTDSFLDNVHHICNLGKYFGLSLDKFEINDELVYFEWRGTKKNMLRFYTYYSKNMTSESLESRVTTQKIILAK
jgi:hypothetical protein